MTLKAVVDSLDDVGENLHELYVEKDGKFVLALEGIDAHPDLHGLKRALEGAKERNKKLTEQNKVLQERVAVIPEGFDPDEFARLRAQLEEYERDPAKQSPPDQKAAQEAVAARKMLEQKIAGLEKNHVTELDKLKKQLISKDDFIGRLLVEEGLTKALVEAGVAPQFQKAAKAMLKSNVKVVNEDGEYKAIVSTDTGDLDIPGFVNVWAQSDEGKPFIPAAKGADAAGGSRPAVGKGLVVERNPWTKEHWNLTAQGQMVRSNRALAEKLARQAGKSIPVAT